MDNYSKAFSPSFKANTFVRESFLSPQIIGTPAINLSNIDFNAASNLKFNPVSFTSGLDLVGGSSPAWTFITAPQDVSWDVANQATRVDMFGTNNPPVVAGSRGMRDLTLGDSLVEGFMRNVTVEGKIAALENLMNYKINQTDGFVSVPVYQVWANNSAYGGPNAYFIIKDIKIKEKLRDLQGKTTRAYVDISLMEVPAFQVSSGRDQASKATAGSKSAFLSQAQATLLEKRAAESNAAGVKATAAATASAAQGVAKGGDKASGAKSATPAKGGQPATSTVDARKPTPGRSPIEF